MTINSNLVKEFQLKVLFKELCTLCDFTIREYQYLGSYTRDLELLISKISLEIDFMEVENEKK